MLPIRGFGPLLVIVLLLGGVGLYFQLEKRVTLVVDGRSQSLRSFSGTVGQLLDRQGLEITEHDEVRPGLDASLSDGLTINVQIAKAITLVLNGEPRTIYVTGKTVDQVLEQINFRSGNNAYVRPSRSSRIEEGDTIVLREAVAVRVAVDDFDGEVITNAPDVGYLLVSMGVILRQQDRVEPAIESKIEPNMAIRVTRVRFKEITEREPIAFETEVRYTDEMLKGQRRVQREGRGGVELFRYLLRLEDGAEVHRKLLGRRVLEEPLNRIELVGTRDPNVQTGVASWYERTGMVAAHKTLPFGTSVRVTNLANGKTVTVVINDRGPYVGGRIIDLGDDAFAQLAPLGAGTINVKIVW